MHLSDFDFDLPEQLIAQFPPADRTGSRLLLVRGVEQLVDAHFPAFLNELSPSDVVVFNNTRVLKARLFGRKASGGKVELLVERVTGEYSALAHIRASHAPQAGSVLTLECGAALKVTGREGALFAVETAAPVLRVLDECGQLPLPPYIERSPEGDDEARYQTVYARTPGAVAAPTAGLHFDDAILEKMRAMGVTLAYVTLHVGAGTFQPVRVENLAEHHMHSEWFDVPAETVDAIAAAHAAGGRVVAIGTTTLRALESAAAGGELRAGSAETSLFILPGYQFKVVDRLLTNFHLPKSTLLMLVSAFSGYDTMRAAYRHAIEQRYRFFSYGDAMLLTRNT